MFSGSDIPDFDWGLRILVILALLGFISVLTGLVWFIWWLIEVFTFYFQGA